MEREGKREITVLKSTANQKRCTHTHSYTAQNKRTYAPTEGKTNPRRTSTATSMDE